MVKDSFTGKDIQRGTGLMYVKKDGTILYFGGKKSEKNYLKLKRTPKDTKWTEFFQKEKKTGRQKQAKENPVQQHAGKKQKK